MSTIFVTNGKWVMDKRTSKEKHLFHTSHIIVEKQDTNACSYLLFFSQRQTTPARGIAGVRELAHLCKGESSVKHLQLHNLQINDIRRWNEATWLDLLFCLFPNVWI